MRSVFSAGVLDGFLEKQFNPFDFYIGVSAGAFNLATYLSDAPGTSLKIFQDLALHKQFISYFRFMRGGHMLDLDWLSEKTFSIFPLNQATTWSNNKSLIVCTTDVETGEATYIKSTPDNFKSVIKASTALPLLYRGFPEINGKPMSDGGIAEGIPVAEAIRRGAKRIMVIRSQHQSYKKKDTPWYRFLRWKLRTHSQLTATMRERISRFEDAMYLIKNPPNGVNIVEICPPEHFKMGRFCRSRKTLQQGYETGFSLSAHAIKQWTSSPLRSGTCKAHPEG